MWTAVDVLRAVARHGAPTLGELDAVLPDKAGYTAALDLAVDGGYLRVVPTGPSLSLDRYRLSPRGRRFLRAAASGNLAA